jgi:type II secretory pathway component PulJ
MKRRTESGMYLIEVMVSCLVGALLLLVTYGQVASLFRQNTTNQNQVLATNIAQQLIDNARNSSWNDLSAIASDGQWQDVPLYQDSPGNALFPRPLLQNPELTYSDDAQANKFNGTAREKLTIQNAAATLLLLQIEISWTDSKGSGHRYNTETVISQTGIHN